ncbi:MULTISPECIES: CBU_0592 family membrane protein [Galbibacter]|uniref:CBU-0592-like domain-containing protein n=1 Tax=Galbibacter pacificus TaxID=2996052 RepID=A0ABT6FW16_9FLAO|nr:hypothetical protein [Galbibacter pacificus]MDG3584108.1 hypothetical protein [Galbibacter pacificus]MDG3587459.1 hypothetical protein [Galbibacter pacificus]
MNIELYTIIGWVGAIIFIIAYLLLVMKKISARKKTYHILNAIGAICLIANAYYLSDFPNVLVNVVWAAIAIYASTKSLSSKG